VATKILKIKTVIEKTGLSRSSIYRLIAAGKFPTQVKLSERAAGFFEHDIEAWLKSRMPGGAQ